MSLCNLRCPLSRDILSLPLRSCAEAGGCRFAKGAGHERTTLTLRVALRESSLHLDCDPAESASFSSMERRPRELKTTFTAPL
jgi:hypothetical protein